MRVKFIVSNTNMNLKFKIGDGVASPVMEYAGKKISVVGNQVMKISGGINKNTYIDLSKYTTDIDIHLCGFKIMNKGKVYAVVVESGQKVDIY